MFIQNSSGQVVATFDNLSSDLNRLNAYLGGGSVNLLSGIGPVSYSKLYRDQVWVNIAVNAIARRLASMPLKAYTDLGGGKRQQLREGPLVERIAAPYEGGSTFDFVEGIVQQYLIHGRSLAWIDRPVAGAPADRWVPLNMDQVRIIRDGKGRPTGFAWREFPGTDPTILLPEDVAVFGFAGGVSPLQPLARTLALEDAAQRSTISFYENGARPGGIITTDSEIEREDVERIEAMVAGKHKGVDNAFRVAVLANVPNAKWQSFDFSAKDAHTIEFRKLNREECVAAYFVPQPVAGILDRATFSNIESQKDMWIVETIGTHAVNDEQRIKAQIITPDAHVYGENTFVEFDLSVALRGSPSSQADTYTKLIQTGRTLNEIRAMDNLEPLDDEWANCAWIPSAYEAIGAPGPLNRGGKGSQPAAPTTPATGGA